MARNLRRLGLAPEAAAAFVLLPTPVLLPAAYRFPKSGPPLRGSPVRKPSPGRLPTRLQRGSGHPGESRNRGPDRTAEPDDARGGRASQ